MLQCETCAALEGVRVLDLTGYPMWLCGRALADLGAEVIKIEEPSGDPGRRIGPFCEDNPTPESSLSWRAYNLNKFGVTLNIESRTGRKVFESLVQLSDIVIESFKPGYMAMLGVGYESLKKINPRIIVTSISPFGQTGPYAQLHASDLEILGMGNILYQQGYEDLPPVRVSFPQAFLHGAVEGITGTMIALYHREQTGCGQLVDVSCQESCATISMFLRIHYEATENIVTRSGFRSRWRGKTGGGPRIIFKCKDGYFCYTLFGGQQGARSNKSLVDWIKEKGFPTNGLDEIDWPSFSYDEIDQESLDTMTDTFGDFFKHHTKNELYEAAMQRLFMGVPVRDIREIVEDSQLSERQYWFQVPEPKLGKTLLYPGPFVKLSETPIKFVRNAPSIGEHNLNVYKGLLGLSIEEILQYRESNAI